MLITRILRGANRASLLARHKLSHYQSPKAISLWRPARAVLLTTLAVRTVVMPVPLVAPATAVAAGPDLSDPSPRVVRVSVAAQEALQLTRAEELSLVIEPASLQPIQVGQSEADARAAAEAAARAEAERKAREAAEAARKAKAATVVRQYAPVNTYGREQIAEIVRAAAAKYGVDANLLLRIGMCESGLRAEARNRSGSSASGVFQFIDSTWRRATPQGRAGMSVFDPVANSEAAAWKIANGGINAWKSSKSCWNR